LLLGYAAVAESEIEPAVERLALAYSAAVAPPQPLSSRRRQPA
jgi:hypothetical protein